MSDLNEIALQKARDEGAEYPVFGESSSGEPSIVDEGGRTWIVTVHLEEVQ